MKECIKYERLFFMLVGSALGESVLVLLGFWSGPVLWRGARGAE